MKMSSRKLLLQILAVSWLPLCIALPGPLPGVQTRQTSNSTSCRCYPGDSCWPDTDTWNQFNQTLGGKLVATVPIASPCHDDEFSPYNATACSDLLSVWNYPDTHFPSSSSVMATYFTNNSCNPYSPRDAQCIVGAHVRYAVNASSPSDYAATIQFATSHNIRLVIRNTAHDYLGKSTGPGGLALWTHHLKSQQVLNYNSSAYTGKAIKFGAGVQFTEAYSFAHNNGLSIVGGNCPSVGIAGGYSQGGGHSLLASRFGLAADQVLEWEVVTANGTFVTATPYQNSDLYWALSGGGGGTYAVVYSMTSIAHPEPWVSAANLTFTNQGVSQDVYFDVVKTWLRIIPSIIDAGGGTVWLVSNTSFDMYPTMISEYPKQKLQQLMNPLLSKLNQSGMAYNYYINDFATFYDGYNAMTAPENVTQSSLGGRLIPRTLLESNGSVTLLNGAIRYICENNGVVSGVSLSLANVTAKFNNSVNPYWRRVGFDAVIGVPYDPTNMTASKEGQLQITNNLMPKLEALTPDGAAYLNEGDPWQPDWQKVFYGPHYDALSAIKRRWDPNSVFYARTAVGSEQFVEDYDGRLCRVAS